MAVIDDDEAFKRAVRSFYEGAGFPELEKASGKKIKYSKDFFDGYEKELKAPPKKSKKELKQDEVEAIDG